MKAKNQSKVKLSRFVNKILKYLGYCICYRRDLDKFFLIRKKCKSYKGDWSIGCYITLPKCASSSIARTLGQITNHPDNKKNPTPEFPWTCRTEAPPFDLEAMKSMSNLNEFEKSKIHFLPPWVNTEDEEVMDNVYYFSVVRNPFSRMHGVWQECRETYDIRLGFKEFLLEAERVYNSNFDLSAQKGERGMLNAKGWWHFKPQLEQLIDENEKLAMHNISKVEYLESDIRKCLKNFKTFQEKNFRLYNENVKPDGFSEKRKKTGYRQFYDKESIEIVENMFWSDIDFFDYEF